MKCPVCDAKVPDAATFCQQCGAKLPPAGGVEAAAAGSAQATAGNPTPATPPAAQATGAPRRGAVVDTPEETIWEGSYSPKAMLGAAVLAAIVSLALIVATASEQLSDDDLDLAREAGLTDDEIWDIGAITALFAMSNRLAHLGAIDPNPEFFLMGRQPR
jgi:alkylhydroperoxidase family enzyme